MDSEWFSKWVICANTGGITGGVYTIIIVIIILNIIIELTIIKVGLSPSKKILLNLL